jgi:hypothetical protein
MTGKSKSKGKGGREKASGRRSKLNGRTAWRSELRTELRTAWIFQAGGLSVWSGFPIPDETSNQAPHPVAVFGDD